MKKIDFEVHFATQGWVDALSSNPGYPRLAKDPVTGNRRLYYQADAAEPYPDALLEKLLDIGAGRIAAMDAAGVDVAVLSLTAPGIEQLEPTWATKLAREANDELAAAIAKYPDRFVGYAALCPKEPDEAVQGAGALRQGTGLQGLEDALQLRRLLHRREAVLAHPGQVRRAGRAHLPASRPCPRSRSSGPTVWRWPARASASAWRRRSSCSAWC